MLESIYQANAVAAILITLSLIWLAAFALTRITKLLRLPNVTGYIISGVLIGPSVLRLIPADIIGGMDFVTDAALTFIAFSVGKYLKLSSLKKQGMGVIVLTLCEALLGGALLGVLFTVMLRFFKVQSNRMVLAIAFVLVTSAVANALNISALLTTMAMGAVFANLCKNSSEVMSLCDHVTPPVFMMFFVLSGAGLNLAILPSIGVVGVIYVVLRVMGKMAGAWFGATVMKADHNVRRWLGPALIPQAGVAIGLTVVAQQVVPQYAEVVRAVVLCGTLIYELVGPGVAKWTLQKAGEIEPGQ